MDTPFTSPASGFIAIYRWQVDDIGQPAFRAAWRTVTMEGRKFGALGSCLTRDANGEFVAIALWPSEAARSAAFARMPVRSDWGGARRIAETRLTVEDDLWLRSPFGAAPCNPEA